MGFKGEVNLSLRNVLKSGSALAVAAVSIAAAPAPTPAEVAHAFGTREQVRQISLSPDGTHFAAILSTEGHGQTVAVAPVDDPSKLKAVLSADGNPQRINRCRWANNARLVCSVYSSIGKVSDIEGFSRELVINSDGSGLKSLSGRDNRNALGVAYYGGEVIDWYGDDKGSAILMTHVFIEEMSTGTMMANSHTGLGVERVDPVSLRRSTIEPPNRVAEEYITDGVGNVRITGRRGDDSTGYVKGAVNYLYRRPGSKIWEPLSTVTDEGQSYKGFNPFAVDPTLNVAYGIDDDNGRKALFKMALDGTNKRELVYANPDVDVDDPIEIGRKQRVVGVSYATDRRYTVFFDPELKKLSQSLAKAVPQLPQISFVDASEDESRLLLLGGNDIQPGMYLVFDKKTKHLDKLLDTRPELSSYTLAPVKSITYTAADGTQVPAYLTLPVGSEGKKIPAIVMPHGGPSSRDEWGFDWLSQFFAARGYAVLQPNYRGSSGYGDKWFVNNGFKSWRTAIGDIDDAGRWLIKQGITTPDHLAIVGWSYGGYAALQSQVLDPDLFKAVVAIAPVTDLDSAREESRNFTNFKLVDAFIGRGPHIQDGSPARHADAFKVPVLMFHGDLDQNVGINESRLMESRLKAAGKPVQLIEFKGLAHSLDDSDARTQMLLKTDAFLRATMKLPE